MQLSSLFSLLLASMCLKTFVICAIFSKRGHYAAVSGGEHKRAQDNPSGNTLSCKLFQALMSNWRMKNGIGHGFGLLGYFLLRHRLPQLQPQVSRFWVLKIL